MNDIRKYSIRENRLKQACLVGMEQALPGSLKILPAVENRYLFLGCLDGVETDNLWGRWKGKFSLSGNMAFVIHVFAGNRKVFDYFTGTQNDVIEIDAFLKDPGIGPEKKLALFRQADAVSYVSQEDILMYGLRGRYLWICVEVMGNGEGTVQDMSMTLPGDNFMNAFPEAYQEWNGFFHRYLSIFSSIYNDFQEQIDNVEELFKLETASEERLCMFAEWMGVDVSGNFLSGEKLRTFVKELPELSKWKGTRKSLERLTEIVLGEKAVILERNILREHVGNAEEKIYNSLYGSHPYCVTLLIRNDADEARRSQLYFILQQFVPVRCELNLVFLEQQSNMDAYCYLDVNAGIWKEEAACLDRRMALDGNMVLGCADEGDECPGML